MNLSLLFICECSRAQEATDHLQSVCDNDVVTSQKTGAPSSFPAIRQHNREFTIADGGIMLGRASVIRGRLV